MKLFNMVMDELGPSFLKKGITVGSTELIYFFKEQPEGFWQEVNGISLNRVPIERSVLTDAAILSGSNWTMLSVHSRSHDDCP